MDIKEYRRKYYSAHKEHYSELNKAYREGHKDEIKEKRHRWYIENKEKIVKKTRLYYLVHQEQARAKKNKHTKDIKLEVLSHYSVLGNPMCFRCGKTDIDVLCIDHIEGNGNKHRKQIHVGGNSFYNWLRKNNYPLGYQVLCFNCNMKKRIAEGL